MRPKLTVFNGKNEIVGTIVQDVNHEFVATRAQPESATFVRFSNACEFLAGSEWLRWEVIDPRESI